MFACLFKLDLSSNYIVLVSSKLITTAAHIDDDDNGCLLSDGEDLSNEIQEITTPSPTKKRSERNSFINATLLSKWKAVRTRHDRVSAAILLPSGVYEKYGGVK